MKHIRKLEEALLLDEVRTDRNKLNNLIHDDFIEIGDSGKTHTKSNVLADLPNEQGSDIKLWSQEYNFRTLSTDTVLLMYKQCRIDQNGKLSRHAKRSSIWFNNNGNWQMIFHQGTPTEPFEKLNSY
ncbi:MAG: DUF4440 domain-containing protein [Cocleimonas sp.]